MGVQAKMTMQRDKKAFLRLQQALISMEQGHFRVLDDDGFVTWLAEYLTDLYRSQYYDFAHRTLNVLGNCSVCATPGHREKVLFVLSLFTDGAVKDQNDQALQALSWIFSRWLRMEQDYINGFEFVCRQIQVLLQCMFDRKMYHQMLPWKLLFDNISTGRIQRCSAIQAVVKQMDRSLSTLMKEHAIDPLNGNLSGAQETEKQLYDSEDRARTLVQELYAPATDKKRRLELVANLSRFDGDVAYILIENLPADAPWHSVRNAVQIISNLGDTRYFELIQPFLAYPDVRVQQQMLAYILRLDEEAVIDQLLLALDVCDDLLKIEIIHQLSAVGNKDAEMALLDLLEKRADISPDLHDDIVLQLCIELRRFPTIRVAKALQHLLEEREQNSMNHDRIAVMAEETLSLLSYL